MAMIKWDWNAGDSAFDNVKKSNEIDNTNYAENQKRTLDSILSSNLDSKGNLNPDGDLWARIAKNGLSPEQIKRVNDFKAGQSNLRKTQAEDAYITWLYGGNPHAGDPKSQSDDGGLAGAIKKQPTIQQPTIQQPTIQQPTASPHTGPLSANHSVLDDIFGRIKSVFSPGGDKKPGDSSKEVIPSTDVNGTGIDSSGHVIVPNEPGFASIGAGGKPVPLSPVIGTAKDDQGNVIGYTGGGQSPYLPVREKSAIDDYNIQPSSTGVTAPKSYLSWKLPWENISWSELSRGKSETPVINPIPTNGERSSGVSAIPFNAENAEKDNQQFLDQGSQQDTGDQPVQAPAKYDAGKLGDQLTTPDHPAALPDGQLYGGLPRSASSNDWDYDFYKSVNPELAASRMGGIAGGNGGDNAPAQLSLPKINTGSMAPQDQIAAAKMLTAKGLLKEGYNEGDLQTAMDNYVSTLQAPYAASMPQLGMTRSVSITPGKPPTISTTINTAEYNKQVQEWYKDQQSIIPQIRKELGDAYAQVYQQSIDRTKLQMELTKFHNDVKQNNVTREGMDALAAATDKVLGGKVLGGENIDPRTFQDANALEAFGKQADAFMKLKDSRSPSNMADLIAMSKNYSVAEGVPPTDGMMQIMMLMGASPAQVAQLAAYRGANGGLTEAALNVASRIFANIAGGKVDGAQMTEGMAFNNEIKRHTSKDGKDSMGTLDKGPASLPADNTPPPAVADPKTKPAPAPAPAPTPKGSWYNTNGVNTFTGTNKNDDGGNNTYWVTARDPNGNATTAMDSSAQKYTIKDAGNGVHLIPVVAPTPTPARGTKATSKGRTTAPKKGQTRTFPNGRKGVWDGTGWRAI